MKSREIFDVAARHPMWYSFWTRVPGAIAILIIAWIIIGYLVFIITGYQASIFSVGVLILIYFLWWFIRGCDYIVSTTSALFTLKKFEKFRRSAILASVENPTEKLAPQERYWARAMKQDLMPSDVIHWCMIPMYNESPEIVYETVQAIAESNYDLRRIAVTINGEGAKRENCLAAVELCKPLQHHFGFFDYTIHDLVPGETPGKGANINSAARVLYKKILDHFQTQPEHVLVTTLDADNKVDKDYFSILTYTFLKTPQRQHVSYQPVIFFFNNFWQAPFFSQVVSLFNTFWILFNFTKKYGPRNFSSHAQPLDSLLESHFRSGQTIVEDGHQYRRSFFASNGTHECVPVYAKIYQDCNLSTSRRETVKAQYNQMRRRAHGAQDIPYVFCQMIDHWNTISKSRLLFEFGRSLEGIVLWSTLHMVLMSGIAFSLFKDVTLSSYLSLGSAISLLTKIASALTITSLLLTLAIFPYHALIGRTEKIKRMSFFLFAFFVFVGPSLIIFSGLPALHTQIAIMLGKPMKKFNVTTKVR